MLNMTPEELDKLDPQNTRKSTGLLVKQCQKAWNEVHKQDLSAWDEFRPENIVFCGMGASIYGGLVIKSLLGKESSIPMELVSDYTIPSFVNYKSTVVLTSYSGNTEETLSCFEMARSRGAKIVVVTKGGELAEIAQSHGLPSYIFSGELNPAGVPRLGIGYTVLGLMGLLVRLNAISLEEEVIKEALDRLSEKEDEIKQKALLLSGELVGKTPVIFAAEHLSGNAHILRNQFNETSKTYSDYFLIPDLNHHLMEGLKYPKENKLYFINLLTENYSQIIQKRFSLTSEVVKKNGFDVYDFMTQSQTEYDDFLECMLFGSYLSLFLGLSYKENPAVNPFVDYFKEELSK